MDDNHDRDRRPGHCMLVDVREPDNDIGDVDDIECCLGTASTS